MTVSIDIDLSATDVYHELAQLQVALESLDDDIDLDLDLDGDIGESLDELSDTLDEFAEGFSSDLDESITRLENLDIDPLRVEDGGGDSGGDTGSDSGDLPVRDKEATIYDKLNILAEKVDLYTPNLSGAGGGGGGFDFGGEDVGSHSSGSTTVDMGGERRTNTAQRGGAFESVRRMKALPLPGTGGGGGGSGGGSSASFSPLSFLFGGGTDMDGDGGLDGINKKFRKLIPSMTTWMNLLGMAIPALGAMAVQAGAVAAAMGSMALAGGAMIGLGLIGHGDTMAESFANAKQQLGDLKQDLFETFEPTADLFSGVQAEFFDFAPGQMDRIARSMEGLITFREDIFELFRGGTEFVSEFIEVIADNDTKISELTKTFSGLIGSSILDLFQWLLDVGYENQGMLIQLGSILKTVSIALYNVFMMVSRAIIMLKPFFGILAYIANILNNAFISGLLATIAVIYILTTAVGGLFTSFLALGTAMLTSLGPAIASLTTWLASWIGGALVAIGINASLAASIGLVSSALLTLSAISGVGLLLSGAGLALAGSMKDEIGGGSIPSNGGNIGRSGSGGQTNNYYEGDTVNVDLSGSSDTSTLEQFRDMRSQSEHEDNTRGPSVGGSYTG